jgi:hypothetical protein
VNDVVIGKEIHGLPLVTSPYTGHATNRRQAARHACGHLLTNSGDDKSISLLAQSDA